MPQKLESGGVLMCVGLIVGMALMAAHPQVSPAQSGRGQDWLSWSPRERRDFVAAYLDGYSRGKIDACEAAANLFASQKPYSDFEDDPERKCFNHSKRYAQNADNYAALLTDFYLKHGDHLDIPVEYFLLLFTDDSYKTVENIENGIRKGDVRTSGW